MEPMLGRMPAQSLPDPIGTAPAFLDVLARARRVAAADVSVLITGETGTGKEILAHLIHRASPRAHGPFVSINCSALPEGLLESELFGVRRGAFTDAHADRDGLLATAAGGTFFLDEIGDMPPSLQVRLLRVIQSREVLPVGGRHPIPIDVRFISATHQDLERATLSGRFRDDLFYRLHGVHLHLPALRNRPEDLPLLIHHFLGDQAQGRTLTPAAMETLLRYRWPGNIRELEQALEAAKALSHGEASIDLEHLPERVKQPFLEPPVSDQMPRHPTMAALEQAYLRWILDQVGGNRSRAARILGIDPSTLHRKIARERKESRDV
jgi:two-component system response regulator HydG